MNMQCRVKIRRATFSDIAIVKGLWLELQIALKVAIKER